MRFIAHRINTRELLAGVPEDCGAEIDIRDYGQDLILHHDPFCPGELLDDFLACYSHKTLILNIKSEGIEWRVKELLQKYNISDYFFLDSSFPMLVKLSEQGESKLCVRISEYESIKTALAMQNKAQWAWIDCFTRMPLDKKNYLLLKEAGYKICLVSPTLVGRPTELGQFCQTMQRRGIKPDAICCKLENAFLWQSLF